MSAGREERLKPCISDAGLAPMRSYKAANITSPTGK